MVSSKNNGIPFFPTLEGYNYVISSVQLPKGNILLDATETYNTPNILPTRTLNGEGRIVEKNENSKTINLPPLKHHIDNNNNNIITKIKDDLTVKGIFKTKHENHATLIYRKSFNHLLEEELISKIENKTNIKIDKFKINNKNEITKPISQLIKFASDDLIETINDNIYINPLLFLSKTKNPFKLKTRKFSVDFSTPWKDKYATSIQIPEGYKVKNIPEPLAIGLPNNIGVFKFQSTVIGNKIKTQSVLVFNTPLITPEYYTILKEFYNKVISKQTEKIILIKNN
ncbi:hypothetical protein [Tenacibaculum aestuariivivum]|uniref:hypothetical protein n=1 Tax=Tenacibaculum aestuariivivum TaxID=2006131 RepID=UPI003AB68005